MGYKYKIRIIFFFEIFANECFFFWLQIKGVANLTIVFFRNELFGFVKTYRRDFIYLRKLYFQNCQFFGIIFFQKFHCVLKKSCFHCHDFFKTVNIAHFKIKACIFIEMTFSVVFFCTKYRSGLKYPVKHTNHHLFIKLRALCQHCRFVEVAELKQVGTTFSASCPDLWCMDFCKSLSVKIITKRSCKRFLNLEFGSFLNITKCNGT